MQKELLYGIIGLFLGVLLTVLVIDAVVNNNATGMMRMMGIRQPTQKMSNIDRHFIEQMIPHHEGAIDMAKLAQERSNRPEIKTLADNITKSQSEEIAKMKNWYRDWYGEEVSEDSNVGMGMGRGMMHGGMMGDTDIEALKSSQDFDKAFIEEMIPHHQMAVMMANMLLQGTNRPEMKQLAQDIIEAQTREIEDMRQWYTNWGY